MLDRNYGAFGPDGLGVYLCVTHKYDYRGRERLLWPDNKKGRGACCGPAPAAYLHDGSSVEPSTHGSSSGLQLSSLQRLLCVCDHDR
ncbi:hypothetical protein TNCV_793741 [Trichonephila clavipes]|nr:hypothetical protein TNCV_793741 [Trichonephila clavipes]